MHRLDAADLRTLKVRPHVRRLVECAWRLGGEKHLEELRLRRWAHALGFRGHCFTKSRRYSTTFTGCARRATSTPAPRASAVNRATHGAGPSSEGASVNTVAGPTPAPATRRRAMPGSPKPARHGQPNADGSRVRSFAPSPAGAGAER